MRSFTTNLISAAASVALTVGAVAMASPAAASQIEGQARRLAVQVADLDLTAPAGRAAAERRINVAAKAVCSTPESYQAFDQTCRNRAVADALAALDQQAGAPADAAR